MRGMNKRQKIFAIAMILWMAVIFSFSGRVGDVSQKDSHRIGMMIGNLMVPSFEKWDQEQQLEFAQNIDYPIRKGSHAMEYTILGILITGAITHELKKKACYIIAWILGTCYAASDEFHQLFVPGRSGQITDVMLDSVGVGIGVLCCYLIWKKAARQKERRES